MYLEESDMRIGFYVAALFFLFLSGAVNAQNDDSMDSFRARVRSEFGSFRENAYKEYNDFRQKANEEYVKFMREKWVELGAEPPIEIPKVKPVPIPEFKENEPLPAPIEMDYDEVITPPAPQPQPTPIAPVPEVPDYRNTELAFQFYGKLQFAVANHCLAVTRHAFHTASQVLLSIQFNTNICFFQQLKRN